MPAAHPARLDRAERRRLNREVARLAVPSLVALVAEPLFLTVDAALVGHLGAVPLAGLGVASTVLQTFIGLMIFLAYATTPLVALELGRGRPRAALAAGVDGLWLAAGIGVVVAAVGWLVARPLVGWLASDPTVAAQADAYLRVSLVGAPAMLVVLAATGALRGLQDTRLPMLVMVAGFGVNIAFNALFLYGLHTGIAGSALGTVIAQTAMAAVLVAVLVTRARRAGAPLRPRLAGVGRAARDGGWLFLRTLALRVGLLASVWLAGRFGAVELAGYQVLFTLFTMVGMLFDALAVAAQALIGRDLGRGDVAHVQAVRRRLERIGVVIGVLAGVALAAGAPWLGRVFTSDPVLLQELPAGLLAVAAGMPLAGFVFVLDGVLMGVRDSRYLAMASLLNLVTIAPWSWLVVAVAVPAGPPAWAALVIAWAGFGLVIMGTRGLTLGLRVRRGDAWVAHALDGVASDAAGPSGR